MPRASHAEAEPGLSASHAEAEPGLSASHAEAVPGLSASHQKLFLCVWHLVWPDDIRWNLFFTCKSFECKPVYISGARAGPGSRAFSSPFPSLTIRLCRLRVRDEATTDHT